MHAVPEVGQPVVWPGLRRPNGRPDLVLYVVAVEWPYVELSATRGGASFTRKPLDELEPHVGDWLPGLDTRRY